MFWYASKDFSTKKLLGYIYDFSVDYDTLILQLIFWIFINIDEKAQYKITFGFVKKKLIRLLSVCALVCFGESLVSNCKEPIKCISLSNRQCQTRPTLVDINSNLSIYC